VKRSVSDLLNVVDFVAGNRERVKRLMYVFREGRGSCGAFAFPLISCSRATDKVKDKSKKNNRRKKDEKKYYERAFISGKPSGDALKKRKMSRWKTRTRTRMTETFGLPFIPLALWFICFDVLFG